MTQSEQRETEAPSGRVRGAQALAFVGLVAALVGALGPAERVRTSYGWPPATLPAETPERLWYTPLLLAAHQPEALAADIPCTLPPALPGAGPSVTVFATARTPSRADGLELRADGDVLTVSIGRRVVDRVPLQRAGSGGEGCAYRLRLGSGRWTLEGGPRQVGDGGALEEMPVVFGLFSALDLRAGEAPTAEVLTRVHAVRTIPRQTIAWTVGVLAILTALGLVSLDRKALARVGARRLAGAVRKQTHPVDAVVGSVLVSWWVLGPAFFDDGWVTARERTFETSGGFSEYYATLGTNLPLDYWIEWLHHWLADATGALVLLRVPALLCLAATWVVARVVLARILGPFVGRSGVALWALAAGFLAGGLAWGMTLRPEPVIALLVVGVLACMVWFLERGSAGPLAASAVLVPLAVAGHPAGIVALAPVAAAGPELLRWARTRPPAATAIVASAIAVVTLLVFVGSDLARRLSDVQATAELGATVAWRYELVRYTSLGEPIWGTPLRRASVALIGLALLAFLIRRRSEGRRLLDLPPTALTVALVLFIATPSKHPWHFGALLGLAAVAIASEATRLRADAPHSRSSLRPLLYLGAAAVAIAWAWAPRHHWNALDLRTLDWTPSFESWLPVETLATALPFVLLGLGALVAIARGRRERLGELPWRAVTWTVPVLCLPLIAFTVAMLAVDTARTDGWTLARSNLGALRGDVGCGLADDLVIADARSVSAPSASDAGSRPLPAWVPPPPVEGLPRYLLENSSDDGSASPWFEFGRARGGVFVAGSRVESELELEWGRMRDGRTEVLGVDPMAASFAVDEGLRVLPWRLLAESELPRPPDGADSFRFRLRSDAPAQSALAVTVPVTYEERELVPLLRERAPTLVLPNVVPYFPCVRLPRLADGVVETPGHIVATRDGAWVLRGRATSPFVGVLDLYRLQRLPVVGQRSNGMPEILTVDVRIPGAVRALPDRTTIVS